MKHAKLFLQFCIKLSLFEEAQSILEEDLKKVDEYFKSARLIMNLSKTEVCAFHLNNKEADKKLKVVFNGTELYHKFEPQ